MEEEVKLALLKRAAGYVAEECVEEYTVSDGGEEMIKKRVTYKDVPPDVSAIKLIVEGAIKSENEPTEAELLAEKEKLIAMLKEGNYETD